MEWLYLTAGVVIGGLLMFLIMKRQIITRRGERVGSLMVEYEDLNEMPNIYLALEVDPDILVKKSRVSLKVKKHVSHE